MADTATQSSAPAPAFHSDDVEAVAEYRSLSALAIVSLLFGIASVLCLLSLAFLVVVICGIVLSLVALRNIAQSEGRLAGRWAATVGLALCIACGVSALSRNAVIRYVRTSQAEEFGTKWLETLSANKTDEAFKLTLAGARPLPPPEPGAPPSTTTPYEDFQGNAIVKSLTAAGDDAKVEFVETLDFTRQTQHDFFLRQRFVVTPKEGASESGANQPIEVDLSIQRARRRGTNEHVWLITRFDPPASAAN